MKYILFKPAAETDTGKRKKGLWWLFGVGWCRGGGGGSCVGGGGWGGGTQKKKRTLTET